MQGVASGQRLEQQSNAERCGINLRYLSNTERVERIGAEVGAQTTAKNQGLFSFVFLSEWVGLPGLGVCLRWLAGSLG